MEVVRAHQTSGGGSETAGGGGGSRPVSIEEKEEVNARQTYRGGRYLVRTVNRYSTWTESAEGSVVDSGYM